MPSLIKQKPSVSCFAHSETSRANPTSRQPLDPVTSRRDLGGNVSSLISLFQEWLPLSAACQSTFAAQKDVQPTCGEDPSRQGASQGIRIGCEKGYSSNDWKAVAKTKLFEFLGAKSRFINLLVASCHIGRMESRSKETLKARVVACCIMLSSHVKPFPKAAQ